MKNIKPAATILLARDGAEGLEVLLLRRNKALAFAGGLWVFPGGKIEPEEIEKSEELLAAAKLAAVRETKEEANLDVDKNALIFYRHWTTPAIEPRRFSTWFFFADANFQKTDVQIDDSEIKEHIWIHPQAALDRLRAGRLAMLPPTLVSLELIRKCNSVAEAKEKLQNETPIFILPVLHPVDGKMICMYEGDAGYDSGNAATAGPRHRLILDMAKGAYHFEYENCDDFLPVNGWMHLGD